MGTTGGNDEFCLGSGRPKRGGDFCPRFYHMEETGMAFQAQELVRREAGHHEDVQEIVCPIWLEQSIQWGQVGAGEGRVVRGPICKGA